MERCERNYVEVVVRHTPEGMKEPMSITFSDGSKYEIDRVLDVRRAAASKAGGTGIRYTVRVGGNRTFLFEDEDRWFIEAEVLHQ